MSIRPPSSSGTSVHHLILPGVTPVAQTNWSSLTILAGTYFGAYTSSSGAQNAEINWDLLLGAGTYTLDLFHFQGTNRGVYTISINGVDIGTTVDGYAAAGAHTKSQITGIAVAIAGVQRLRVLMATKNASSTNYLGAIEGLALTRTA